MNVVKFSDGTFGVRKWSWLRLAYVYKDFNSRGRDWWWPLGQYPADIRASEQTARMHIDIGAIAPDKGVVIK